MKRALALALVACKPRRACDRGRPRERAPARRQDSTLTGAGATFRSRSSRSGFPQLGSAFGISITYSPIGSGAGIAAVTARTVDFGASDAPLSPDQFTACKGCVADPVGALGDGDPVQPAGRQLHPAPDGGRSLAEHLPRQDHDLERLGDQGDQPEMRPAGARRSRRSTAPTTPARRTTSPTTSRPSVPSGSRSSAVASTHSGRPASAARAARASPASSRRPRARSTYVDVAYSLKNKLRFASDPQQRRQVHDAGPARDQRGCVDDCRRRSRATASSRSSIRRRATRSPTRSARSRTSSCRPARRRRRTSGR